MLNILTTDCSKLSLIDLEAIARETGLIIRRSSKFSADAFLTSLLEAVGTGQASLNQICGQLKGRLEKGMARQSISQRFNKKSSAFLQKVQSILIEQRFTPLIKPLRGCPFDRIFIEDSTFLRMLKSNAEVFPASGNRYGETAGVKVNLSFDLVTGNAITHTLESALEQDKTIGKETLAMLRPRDLIVRDMGYFILSEFDYIEQNQAFWLSRLPLTTSVTLLNGKQLEKLLKSSKADVVDLEVKVGNEGKRCRLVAVRASQKLAKQRRGQRRKQAKELGKNPNKDALVRDGWHIMLTNLNVDEMSVRQLCHVYQARWSIEIQFRAWKQSLKLDSALNRKTNQYHMEALILAGMIAHQLSLHITSRLVNSLGSKSLSFEKFYDLLLSHLIKMSVLSELQHFEPDIRHVTKDVRRRESPLDTVLYDLS